MGGLINNKSWGWGFYGPDHYLGSPIVKFVAYLFYWLKKIFGNIVRKSQKVSALYFLVKGDLKKRSQSGP